MSIVSRTLPLESELIGGIHANATFTHSVVWQPFYKDRSKICAGADDVKRGRLTFISMQLIEINLLK